MPSPNPINKRKAYCYKRYLRMMLRRYPHLWATSLGSEDGIQSRRMYKLWWRIARAKAREANPSAAEILLLRLGGQYE